MSNLENINENQKILNFLGLAIRARKVLTGLEIVESKINKVSFIFLANDASNNTRKAVMNKCEYYHIEYCDLFSSIELTRATGKENRMVYGIIDENFSYNFKKLIRKV